MKKLLIKTLVLVILAGAGTTAYLRYREPAARPTTTEAAITRGDIVEAVQSTGTLAPMRTVNIGTQVSGIVKSLYGIDFNSIVKKGQVIAELDPALIQEQVDSSEASLAEAQIALTRDEATLATDRTNAERAETLFESGVATEQDRDEAVLQQHQDESAVLQDRGAVVVAQSNVENAKVNLSYCTITSPVDGVVIERDVDEGQTVASRASAPTLYILGTDLRTLQLIGNVDEADVAKVLPGQDVTFGVESYPNATFHGTVQSVRLNATSTSNVVTYQVVISAPNPDLRLKPSMTANIRLETARTANVLRVSNAATRFHPTSEMFAAYHQAMPPPISMAAATLCAGVPCTPPSGQGPVKPVDLGATAGETIDHEFTPPPPTHLAGQVWVLDHDQLRRVRIEIGISDGTWTQVVSGDLREGEEVLTGITLPGTAAANNPLLGNRGRGPGGPGGFGGPGGGFGPGR